MKISVVVPALDEAQQIAGAIESVRVGSIDRDRDARGDTSSAPISSTPETPSAAGVIAAASHIDSEVWVVDGGSRDETVSRAEAAGARVLAGPRGRARQLSAGAQACDGEVLLFLHADTRLSAGWDRAVVSALADESVCGGAFHFRFSGPRDWRLRLVEAGANWRARRLHLPYGDQAIFVRRRALDAIGGVPQAPLMEDLDLVRAMKRVGRLVLLPLPVRTSPRRYQAGGTLRTAGRHMVAACAWGLGVDRQRIARWYTRAPRRQVGSA